MPPTPKTRPSPKTALATARARAAGGLGATDPVGTLAVMPLYARHVDEHYPDRRERSPHVDHHVVLSGGLEVGGLHRIGSGPSEGRWSWGASLTSSSGFTAGGYSHSSDGCKELIGASFRKRHADSEHEALVALALCWSRRTYWAGLEPVAPLRRGMKRV